MGVRKLEDDESTPRPRPSLNATGRAQDAWGMNNTTPSFDEPTSPTPQTPSTARGRADQAWNMGDPAPINQPPVEPQPEPDQPSAPSPIDKARDAWGVENPVVPGDFEANPDLNPGQKSWREKVNDGREKVEGARERARNLWDAETQTGEPEDTDEDVRQKEETPRQEGFKNNTGQKRARPVTFGDWVRGWKGNYKTAGGVIGLITGGGSIMLAFLLIPAALATALERIMMNDAADSTRINLLMRRAFVSALIGNKANSADKVARPFSSMSEGQAKIWKDAGFKLEPNTPDADGRYPLQSMQFPEPDNTKVSNSKDLFAHLDSSLDARVKFEGVIDARASPYNSRFAEYRKILGKWGIDGKGEAFKANTDRDPEKRRQAMDADIDRQTGAVTETDPEVRRAKYTEKLRELKLFDTRFSSRLSDIAGSKGAGKVFNAADAVGAVCSGYTLINATETGLKTLWYKDIILFGWGVYQTLSQAIDQGNVSAEKIEYIFRRFNWYLTPQLKELHPDLYGDYSAEEYNLTAFDSPPMEAMIVGNLAAVKKFTEQYMGWHLQAAVVGATALNVMESSVGGKDNLKDICFGAKVIGFVGIAQCLSNPLSAGVCAGLFVANQMFAEDIIKYTTAILAAPALKLISEANLTSKLKGVRFGAAFAAFIGLLMAEHARSSAAVSATSVKAVERFTQETDEVYNKDVVEVAKYKARQTPFDASNQYSFISQLASTLNPQGMFGDQKTPYSHMANIMTIAFSPAKFLSESAGALQYQPSQLKLTAKSRISKCPDKDIKGIGAVCDGASGKTIGVLPEGVAEALKDQVDGKRDIVLETVKFMYDNGYIDETRKAIGDNNPDGPDGDDEGEGEKFEYIKFKNYCTEDRVDPVGRTSKDITQAKTKEDLDWWVYARCIAKNFNGEDQQDKREALVKKLFYFTIFNNLCETQVVMADDVKSCAEEAKKTAAKNTGDWQRPTTGPCTSGYGPRWGTQHAGIDIAPPSGTPIVAPTSMKITNIVGEGAHDGYGNSVMAEATDGSGYSFRFGHMLSTAVNSGQEMSKGETIGLVGSTGDSSGPHLHFEIFPPGTDPMGYTGAVDPVPILRDHGVNETECGANSA